MFIQKKDDFKGVYEKKEISKMNALTCLPQEIK